MGYVVGLTGVWILQDALASIAYYPAEKWKWNHAARVVRAVIGLSLMIMGAFI